MLEEVQWLRLCLPLHGVWVQSLVRELRFHMSWGMVKNWRGKKKIIEQMIQDGSQKGKGAAEDEVVREHH